MADQLLLQFFRCKSSMLEMKLKKRDVELVQAKSRIEELEKEIDSGEGSGKLKLRVELLQKELDDFRSRAINAESSAQGNVSSILSLDVSLFEFSPSERVVVVVVRRRDE